MEWCVHHPGWVTPAKTHQSWLQTSTTTDLITLITLEFLKKGCLNIVNCIKKIPSVVSGHYSDDLNNTGLAGKELPAEIQQSNIGQNGLSGTLCQCQGVLLACPSSCLHREHSTDHIPWHSTGSSCRDVQEGSGTFPTLPMELHSHWGISHCSSPGCNQTLKQISALSFKPPKNQ